LVRTLAGEYVASKLRLTFCNDWLSDETDEIEVPASYTAERAANMYAKLVKLPSEIGEEALIRFQREWRHPELKDYELLDALAHGYGFLLDLLLDGHELLDEKTRRECPFFSELTSSNVRLPEAMQARSCDSSVWYRLKDRTITSFQISQTSHLVKEGLEETKNRYEIDPSLLHQGDSLAYTCRRWMQIGKQFLAKDGHIVPVFFIESETTAIPYAMQSRDRADKHAMVRLAADAVVAHRAHTVVHLGEVWTSRVDLTSTPPAFRHAADDPRRGEAISVTGMSAAGEIVDFSCEFTRSNSGIEFGELRNFSEFRQGLNSFEPIRKAFLKLKNEIQKKD
jgi:hypothetical protein